MVRFFLFSFFRFFRRGNGFKQYTETDVKACQLLISLTIHKFFNNCLSLSE